jgi:hypothetical protein
METLKTMLANNQETLARMNASMKANQEKANTNIKTMQDKMDASHKEAEAMRNDMKTDQAEPKSTIEEKMKDAMQSMRSELDETIRHRIEKAMTNVSRETHKLQTELTEKIEKTQVELQTAEVSLDARTRKLEEDLTETFKKTCAAIEETKHELQARLEAAETRTERGNTPTASTRTAPPPTFNGNIKWSVFRRQFEIVAEHNRWSDREKLTYLITTLKGRAADVLYGIPTSTTYEETLQALEDRFGDQHFSAAYRCPLITRTQKAGKSLQDFDTAIEQLAHRAYPTLPEDHIRREAGKAFAYGVKAPDIKIQLLLGGYSKRGPQTGIRTIVRIGSRKTPPK